MSFWDDLEKERGLGLKEVEDVLRPEMTLKVGPSWRRYLGDKNAERLG